MDARIKELLTNINAGVEKANTISHVMEEPYDASFFPQQLPFNCNYMIHYYIGSMGNTNVTLGHGDVYIYIDNDTQELKGAKFTNCASSFISKCQTIQLCYGVRFKESRAFEFERTSYLFVF